MASVGCRLFIIFHDTDDNSRIFRTGLTGLSQTDEEGCHGVLFKVVPGGPPV